MSAKERPRAPLARLAIALAPVLLGLGCATSPNRDDGTYTQIPGTRVSAVVPPGFSMSDDFAGFANLQGYSLLVTEWSQSEPAMLAEIEPAGLTERGMSMVDEEFVTIDGEPRRLLHVTQERPDGLSIDRRILVIGDAVSTSVLTATAPHSAFPAELKESLRGIRRDAEREVAPFEGLGFELDETDSLGVSARVAEIVHMAARGSPVPPAPEDPQLVAGRANLPEAADLANFSAHRLSVTPGISGIVVIADRHLEVGGLPGYELIAQAEDLQSRVLITLLQMIAIDESRYYLVQARVATARADEYLPEFRKVASSFRRTD